MEKMLLGNTDLQVTRLCFGLLPLGPMQRNLPVEEGARLLRRALEEGVNFVDTAEAYGTYGVAARAMGQEFKDTIIATKSHAVTYEEMEKSIQKALKELQRDYIDIFHLHAARAKEDLFTVRQGAFECLQEYKARGVIRFIGVSTHSVTAMQAAINKKEVDVVFPIINSLGMGIIYGDLNGMLAAIEQARAAGKGLYAMKALAGGHLIQEAEKAIEYVRSIPGISSVAIGMVKEKELEMNLRIFRNQPVPAELKTERATEKKLLVSRFCIGCGTCVDTCPNFALSLKEGKAVVDSSKCILCGYCNPVCPQFALRLV